MNLKDLPKPENDIQFIVYAVLGAGLIGFFLWLKFGKTNETTVKKEIADIIEKELEKIQIKIPIGNKSNDPTETAIFKTETRTGIAAIRATLDGVERHYEDNFRKLEEVTLPVLFEQINSLTSIVVELKTTLKIHMERDDGV